MSEQDLAPGADVNLHPWSPPGMGKAILIRAGGTEKLHAWVIDPGGHPFHAEALEHLEVNAAEATAYFDIDFPNSLRLLLPSGGDAERDEFIARAIALDPRLQAASGTPWDFGWDEGDEPDEDEPQDPKQ